MRFRNSIELMLTVSEDGTPLHEQIYQQIRQAIINGGVVEGDRLPSVRKLQSDLKVSHTTIERAYQQLSAEGYVKNIPRSGFVVSSLDIDFLQLAEKVAFTASMDDLQDFVVERNDDAFFAENSRGENVRYDFSYANLPPDSFPVRAWRKIQNQVLYSDTIPALARYAYYESPSRLNIQLSHYLKRARGLICDPNQVVIQTGTDGALATIFQLFNHDAKVFGMEEPGYGTAIEAARRNGYRLVPLPTDLGSDAFLEAVKRSRARIVFTTPSHQFPTGTILSLQSRIELLKLAEQHDFYIIEDDSCNEYRYNTDPVPALASLDAYDRVIYVGSVSKVLSPALRISYIVFPRSLMDRYYQLFNNAHLAISWLDQETLATFMEDGGWDSHIRHMVTALRKRHDVLLHSITEEFGERIEVQGAQSGMHLFATIDNGMTQDELLSSALSQSANVYGTHRMWFSKKAPENHLMIGFSSIDPNIIPAGVAALKRAWI